MAITSVWMMTPPFIRWTWTMDALLAAAQSGLTDAQETGTADEAA